MVHRSFVVAVIASVALVGCGTGEPANGSMSRGTASPSSPSHTDTDPSASFEVFGGLTVSVELESAEVVSGSELMTTMSYENHSATEVTTIDCELSEGASAVVERDDTEPDLWLRPLVDCDGDYAIVPGDGGDGVGPTLLARTKDGQLLRPGPYDFAFELDGQMMRIPIVVLATDDGS
jgi:hypothetical protein